MRYLSIILAGAAALALTATAQAQVVDHFVSPFTYSVPYGPYFGAAGYTPAEGYYHGMADLIRARGKAYEDFTSGMINYELARSQYLENRQKALSTRLARKRMAEAERRREWEEELAVWRRYRARKSQVAAAPALSISQLNPATGELRWPAALMRDEFAAARTELEGLVAQRARLQTSVRTSTAEVQRLSQEISLKSRLLQDELRQQVATLPAEEYIEAHKFLQSLAYAPTSATS